MLSVRGAVVVPRTTPLHAPVYDLTKYAYRYLRPARIVTGLTSPATVAPFLAANLLAPTLPKIPEDWANIPSSLRPLALMTSDPDCDMLPCQPPVLVRSSAFMVEALSPTDQCRPGSPCIHCRIYEANDYVERPGCYELKRCRSDDSDEQLQIPQQKRIKSE